MIGDVRGQALQHAEFVRVLGDVGIELRNPVAALAVLGELPRRPKEFEGVASARGDRLAIVLLEPGLVVESVDLGG